MSGKGGQRHFVSLTTPRPSTSVPRERAGDHAALAASDPALGNPRRGFTASTLLDLIGGATLPRVESVVKAVTLDKRGRVQRVDEERRL